MSSTQWNGEPCTAARVTVTVADDGFFPEYWARELVGTRRKAVQVEYGGQTFYLDDEDGGGWNKVTHGGSPWLTHSSLTIEPGSVEPRADTPEEIRFARRFVATVPGQPDIHGVEFPSGRIIADTETGLTGFLNADVITADYPDAVIHWADEESTDGR